MAAPITTVYYIVTGAREPTCEKTYILVVYTDSAGVLHQSITIFGGQIFDLYEYVRVAVAQVFGALPAEVQAWSTLYAYDPTSFTVYV